MEADQVKANLKRHSDSGESGQNKIQRLDSTEEPIRIVDLNDFCLMKIFEYLDFQSLFNVIIANGHLRPAAIDVHQRKFSRNPVEVIAISNAESAVLNESDKKIKINGLKPCLRYLRCLGSSVSDLTINYVGWVSQRYEYVHQYVNKYCADSLVEITFRLMPSMAIKQFDKVFVKVQNLCIVGCDVDEQLPTLVEWFPNLRHFEIHRSRIYQRFTRKPFKHLEHLKLYNVRCDGFQQTNQIVADLVKGLHTLKSLEILFRERDANRSTPISILLFLIEGCPSITKLIFPTHCYDQVDSTQVQRIIAEHPALVELKLGYPFGADDAISLIRQLNSLKVFQFGLLRSEYIHLRSQLDDEWKATASNISYWTLTDRGLQPNFGFDITLER